MAKVLNNIALCYQGITMDINEKSNFTTYLEDFKGQINHLESLGYQFVKPSGYYVRYNSIARSRAPYATILFDAAFKSIRPATIWLAEKSIPFGVAILGQRLCKLGPEEGYIAWRDINIAVRSGLCEILHNTYDLHHFCLAKEGEEIINQPILGGPCFVDHGEFLYIADGNKKKYWDMTQINNLSWDFPVLGTDLKTGNEIRSVVYFKADTNIVADRMRLWACVNSPHIEGYSAKIEIRMNGSLVAKGTVELNGNDSHMQWYQQEFVTVLFQDKFEIIKGNSYKIEFVTQNAGNAVFLIHAVPDFSGNFMLSTSCTEGTFPKDVIWPARACIILADGTGITVTTSDFLSYVKDDLYENNMVIRKYLNASWRTWTTGYADSNNFNTIVLGGTYSNGQLAATKVRFHATQSFTAEILRISYAARLGNKYPLIIEISINDVSVGSFEANWCDWHYQEVQINSYRFKEGYDYTIKFVTQNASPFGQGLLRGYMDQPKAPQPIWNSKLNKIAVPPEKEFEHASLYEVINPEGTDVYPDGAVISNESKFNWVMHEPYDGPGKVFLDILSCSSNTVKLPTQICYPYGAYYATTIISELLPDQKDIHPDISGVFSEIGIKAGYSVIDEPVKGFKNARLHYSKNLIPMYLVEGNAEQTKVIQNIDLLTGSK